MICIKSTNIYLKFIMPAELGRLPNMIGTPAGGSLTADQWLLLAVVVAPVAVILALRMSLLF